MNSKNTLIGLIILIVVFIGLIVYLGKQSTKPKQTTVTTQQPTPQEPQQTVTLGDSGFNPKTLTIQKGTRVIWNNKSLESATVNSDVHPTHRIYPPLNLGQFNTGTTLQLVFKETGRFQYHNHLKPAQTGVVIVQ